LIDLCNPAFQATQFPLNGVSLKPLLTGKRSSVKDAAISYWNDSISVRNTTHRLVVSRVKNGRQTPVELYDIRSTPDPIENIADQHPEIVAEMKRLLPSLR
jgi:hypothetical protein